MNNLNGFTTNLVKKKSSDEKHWSISRFLNHEKFKTVGQIISYLSEKQIPFFQKEKDLEIEGSILVLPNDCSIEYNPLLQKEEVEQQLLEKLNKVETFCFMITKRGLSFDGNIKQLSLLLNDGWK